MTTNAERWERARFTRSTQINMQAEKTAINRARYEAVSKATGVPWDVIGVIHYREASGSFAGVLHNGERIIGTGKVTKLVPKGRGPFSTWEDAAVDALVNAPPYAARNKDWSIGGTLDLLERYNGLGYRNKGLPSPYLWAGTDQYVKGKYVADSKYDPNHVDQQLGVAPILMKLREGVVTKPVVLEPIGHLGPKEPIIVHDAEPITTTPAAKPNMTGWIIAAVIFAAIALYVLTQVKF